MTVYRKQLYPAKAQRFASASGYPASGFFAMHITYPDTEYGDAVVDWEYGENTNDQWKQGLTVIVRTPRATVNAPAEDTNVIIVDLKQAATDDTNSKTYSLGTEEAARLIAAKINSRRVKQVGETHNSENKDRYLRARYVRMSGKPTYTGTATIAKSAQVLRVEWDGAYRNGYPSDMPQTGTLTYTDGNHTNLAISYTAIAPFRYGPKKYLNLALTQTSFADFTVTGGTLTSLISQVTDAPNTTLNGNVSAGATTITLTSGSSFGNSGNGHIDGDSFSWTGKSSAPDPLHVLTGCTGITSAHNSGVGVSIPESLLNATVTVPGEPAKHTVVLTWETNTPASPGGYWAAANGGPVVQGLGASVPIWYFTAKPMDGGNMGLPAPNYDSRGSTAVAHTTGHGYVRFSIEGLNSCNMVDMPPPDYTVTSPSIAGITKVDSDTTGSSNIKLAEMEYGTTFNASEDDMLHLSNGYRATATADSNNMLSDSRDNLTNISYSNLFEANGIDGDGGVNVPRPIFSAKSLNSARVTGLQISNEHMVFDDIHTTDDQGNELVLPGGSPLGVVIKDFTVQNTRTDAVTGEEVTGPSTTDGKLTPNLQIQLPSPDEIPGEIFVRSGHDRVQAWSNQTWGMGGLTAPDPRASGVSEASGGVSQFDTHDRMLIFHCQRILHPSMATKHGLTPHTTAGAVPSGTTRLFASHRITDHAERGSVLTQTLNGGVDPNNLYPYPHHRIRFARQGHSFITPMTHRGTPSAMRRQLHRSHGSSYSLLFEAETEHKHLEFPL